MGDLSVEIVLDAPYRSDVVPTGTPAVGWLVETATRDWQQAGAELELMRRSIRRSHTVAGPRSVRLPWPFAPLAPGEEAWLRVRVRGQDGAESDWSPPRRVLGGFLGPDEWIAAAIGLRSPDRPARPACLRTEFEVRGPIRRALLSATAIGVYQAALNGVDVDDQVMKPGWTPYGSRTVHETTEVTRLLAPGGNAIGVRLAGGWATERYGFGAEARVVYAEQPSFAGQLRIEYLDGSVEVVATDGSWRASPGPLLSSGLYAGEEYDARLALVDGNGLGFAQHGFDDASWGGAALAEPMTPPEGRVSPFVRRVEELAVREVIATPGGRTVLDFGQNLVGRLRIRVSGPRGTVVTLRHAEVLEDGELGTRPLRAAAATDRYTLAGEGEETWEPEFTLHGFRYAEVDGWPGELDPAAVVAVVVHSDMERTGWFETSHPLLNRLHENVVWGLRGNFLSVPTDCPQRDERLGWTGDIQIFAPTACFLYDVRGFLDSWLRDLALEQDRGVVPFVVPNVLGPATPAAAWGDAATIVPWTLHERFADTATLERQYPSMKGWVDAILERAGISLLWRGGFQFGDWLDPDAPPDDPASAKTAPDLIASAYLCRSTELLARAARLLGRDRDAESYGALARRARAAFAGQHISSSGVMSSDAPTAYALAIVFDLAPEALVASLGRRLAELVRRAGHRISTGFVGTPLVQDALTRTGHLAEAARLLLQTECPSWLYPVIMGATTVWERWDSMLPDGTINPGEMTSFNHYALGSVADWLHRVVAGIAPAAPGYARLRIEPLPLDGLDWARASHLTPFGPAGVAWRRTGSGLRVQATVPPNTRAEVVLPDGSFREVGSGNHEWDVAEEGLAMRDGSTRCGSWR